MVTKGEEKDVKGKGKGKVVKNAKEYEDGPLQVCGSVVEPWCTLGFGLWNLSGGLNLLCYSG